MLWLYDLPTWLFGLLVAGGTTALALAGLALVHRRSHRRRARQAARPAERRAHVGVDTLGGFFGGVLTLYDITLGLVTVATWTSDTGVADVASAEAAALGALYRDADSYPEPTRTALRADPCAYAVHVIRVAWPAQRERRLSAAGDERVTAMQRALVHLEPATAG